MVLPKSRALAVLSALLVPFLAQGDENLWLVAVGAQADADGSAAFVGSFDWGVSDNTWLNLAAGATRSPSERADVQTRNFRIGIDQTVGPVGFTLGAETWGEPDEIESKDFDASLYFRNDSFSIGILAERRDIDVTFTITGPLDRPVRPTVGLSADGWGLRVSGKAGKNWRLFAVGKDFSYSRDLTGLPRLDQFDFLASSALTLANSFVDYEMTAGVERQFGNIATTLTYGRDRSAVDGSVLDSTGVGILFPAGRRADIELTLGASNGDDFGSDVYGGVFLFLYGGS